MIRMLIRDGFLLTRYLKDGSVPIDNKKRRPIVSYLPFEGACWGLNVAANGLRHAIGFSD
jgi:hypothetical protein